jgi:hypothetical protein
MGPPFMRKLRLWRVETTHVVGYTAPLFYVFTEEKRREQAKAKAIEIAKSQSRLADFPQYTFTAHEV